MKFTPRPTYCSTTDLLTRIREQAGELSMIRKYSTLNAVSSTALRTEDGEPACKQPKKYKPDVVDLTDDAAAAPSSSLSLSVQRSCFCCRPRLPDEMHADCGNALVSILHNFSQIVATNAFFSVGGCGRWFHFSCVLPAKVKSKAKQLAAFICPDCFHFREGRDAYPYSVVTTVAKAPTAVLSALLFDNQQERVDWPLMDGLRACVELFDSYVSGLHNSYECVSIEDLACGNLVGELVQAVAKAEEFHMSSPHFLELQRLSWACEVRYVLQLYEVNSRYVHPLYPPQCSVPFKQIRALWRRASSVSYFSAQSRRTQPRANGEWATNYRYGELIVITELVKLGDAIDKEAQRLLQLTEGEGGGSELNSMQRLLARAHAFTLRAPFERPHHASEEWPFHFDAWRTPPHLDFC